MAATNKAPTGNRRATAKTKKPASPRKKFVISDPKKRKISSKSKTQKPASKAKKPSKPAKKNQVPANKKLKPAKKNTLLKGGGSLAFPRSVALSIFTPALLPATPDQLAIGTARFAGMFFVLLGGFFATYHTMAEFFPASINVFSKATQVASTIAVCDPHSSTHDPNHELCDDGSGDTLDDQINAEPDVSFHIAHNEPFNGEVKIKITTTDAEEVGVKLYSKSAGTFSEIGYATLSSENSWNIHWRTQDFVDDEYKIYAFVKNAHGTYEEHSNRYFEVENISHNDSTEHTNTETDHELHLDDSVSVDDDSSSVKIGNVNISPAEPLAGLVQFEIEVENATEVKVRAKNQRTAEEFFVGAAYQKKQTLWILEFDSTVAPDGDYDVTVTAKSENARTDLTELNFKINNSKMTSDDVSISTLTEELVTPADLFPEVDIDLSVAEGTVLSGDEKFTIAVKGASFIEVYMIPYYTNTQKFLGLAKKISSNTWSHNFDTKDLPNGKYSLFVRIKNTFGLFDSERVQVTVENAIESSYSEEQKKYIDTLTRSSVSEETVTASDIEMFPEPKSLLDTEDRADESTGSTAPSLAAREDNTIKSVTRATSTTETFTRTIQERLDTALTRLTASLRAGNTEETEKIKVEIKKFRDELNSDAEIATDSDPVLLSLKNKLDNAIVRVEEDVIKTEKIVKERTGESASKDSDNDGITDYDEVNIYNTDPFVADSDNDGFIDGAEILNGYDPKDATPETLVVYESPKESGIVRSDLLVVDEVVQIDEPKEDKDGVKGLALIKGKAMPNSFVTIYIFSSPVIVTVKTDADGSWEYQFDKELEDGSHEVYVGVTDNAGRIVAKSEPLQFIKEAQAFTPVDADEAAVTSIAPSREDDSLISSRMFLIIMSISVVTIGLVLILLGMHLAAQDRRRTFTGQRSEALV